MVSKIERSFLNILEKRIEGIKGIKKIKRQKIFMVDGIEKRRIDGFIEEFNLIIEVDGNYWHNYPIGLKKDKDLNNFCQINKINIFRFWETELNQDMQKCINKIVNFMFDMIWFYENREGLYNDNWSLYEDGDVLLDNEGNMIYA